MPVKINGTTSGSVTLAAPDTGSDVTLTLPTTALATQAYADSAASTGGGLVLIDEESFSAVSSVSLNNVFSATYDNYRIVVSNATGSIALNDFLLRVRSSGTDLTTNTYVANLLYNTQAAGPTRSFASATNGAYLGYVHDNGTAAIFDITNPFSSARTQGVGLSHGWSSASSTISGLFNWTVNNTTSYDGFTLYVNAGTISGTIRVYGYKEA